MCPCDEVSLYLSACRSSGTESKGPITALLDRLCGCCCYASDPLLLGCDPATWGESVAFYQHNGVHLSAATAILTTTSDKIALQLLTTTDQWHITCIQTTLNCFLCKVVHRMKLGPHFCRLLNLSYFKSLPMVEYGRRSQSDLSWQ